MWFTRVVKSRTLAATLVQDGKVRVNRQRVTKASHTIRIGDVVTLAAHRQVHVFKMLAPGTRRGPAQEARTLYEDLTPPTSPTDTALGAGEEHAASPQTQGLRDAGAGRPTKRDRRAIARLSGRDKEDGP